MKRRQIEKGLITIAILGGFYLLLIVITWASNGGIPGSGPIGNSLPPHIHRVSPKDGEMIRSTPSNVVEGYCVDFLLLVGNGMGKRLNDIHFYLDGIEVSNSTSSVLTLDFPSSYAGVCYGRDKPLLPGWYTAKIVYKDNLNNIFRYTWRFLVLDVDGAS